MTCEASSALAAGQRVIWRHVCRGGYGYVVRLDATVVRVTDKRVIVDTECLNGAVIRRKVRPESLQARAAAPQMELPP